MSKKALSTALLMTFAAAPLQAFEVDIDRRDALDRLGVYTISDLAAGQRGLLDALIPMCHENGRLFVFDYPLDPDPWQDHWEVIRLPSGEFNVNFIPGKDRAGTELTSFNWGSFLLTSCSPVMTIERFPVSTLNGHEKYSAWLEYILSEFTIKQ